GVSQIESDQIDSGARECGGRGDLSVSFVDSSCKGEVVHQPLGRVSIAGVVGKAAGKGDRSADWIDRSAGRAGDGDCGKWVLDGDSETALRTVSGTARDCCRSFW